MLRDPGTRLDMEDDPVAPDGPLAQVRRAGETWRFAREQLRELSPQALHALAAREHLPTTAGLVERLADEVTEERFKRGD